MIQIYYTGAVSHLSKQANPILSLGGFISSTVIPNNVLSNIFGSISLIEEEQIGLADHVLIAIKNDGSNAIQNIKLWTSLMVEGASANFEIAIVIPTVTDGIPVFEKIQDRHSSPYYAQFYSTTTSSKLSISNKVASGDYFGVWIKRVIANSGSRDPQTLYDMFKAGSQLPTDESVDLNVSYTEN
jgi:hypothetical protein